MPAPTSSREGTTPNTTGSTRSAAGGSVSDVFLGYRNLPHFVIAVQQDLARLKFVLRATIDTDVIDRLVRSLVSSRPATRSSSTGRAFCRPRRDSTACSGARPLPALPYSTQAELVEMEDESGEPLIVSYAQIDRSPFTLVLLSSQDALHEGWLSLRRELLVFLVISIVLMLAVIVGGSTYMVNRAREADLKRAALFHKMEYTNKMAAIGRLGAGWLTRSTTRCRSSTRRRACSRTCSRCRRSCRRGRS